MIVGAPAAHGSLKVLHVITRLDPGGTLTVLEGLLRCLGHEGVHTEVATGLPSKKEDDRSDRFSAMGIPVHKVPGLVREVSPIDDLRALRALHRMAASGRYDILHCHTSKAGFLGRLAAKWAGVPAVYSPHGNFFFGYFGRPWNWVFSRMEARAARWSARILTPSAIESEEYLDRGVGRRDQYVCIPNGIDFSEWPPPVQARGGRGRIVCFVGRLDTVKGPQILMEAIPMIRAGIPDAEFWIVGDGPLREKLERRARVVAAEAVRFHGFVDRPFALMQSADVLVVPSLNEGFGLSALEGLALGCAIVASRVGGLVDVLGEGEQGRLVEPGNPAALAEAVVGLLVNGDRRIELSKSGAGWARSRFGVQQMASRIVEIYRQVMPSAGTN